MISYYYNKGHYCYSVCPPTCRGQHVQSLQAVFARWRVVSGLGEAALAVVQHGGWRDDAGGRDFTYPQVQLLNLLLLIDLQVLHLRQVSVIRKEKLKKESCILFLMNSTFHL